MTRLPSVYEAGGGGKGCRRAGSASPGPIASGISDMKPRHERRVPLRNVYRRGVRREPLFMFGKGLSTEVTRMWTLRFGAFDCLRFRPARQKPGIVFGQSSS
jgi:hypothetical protein